MVPWTRVRRLSSVGQPGGGAAAGRGAALLALAGGRAGDRAPVGYLLAKDLIGRGSGRRGLDAPGPPAPRGRGPTTTSSRRCMQLQQEGATVCVVQDARQPGGPGHDRGHPRAGRRPDRGRVPARPEAVPARCRPGGRRRAGPRGPDAEQAIAELAAAIPADRLPPGARIAGPGAGPRARASRPTSASAWRSRTPGARTSRAPWWSSAARGGDRLLAEPAEPVRLVFLLVTPAEKPDVQVFLLGQLARVAGNASSRERLLNASSASEVIEVVTEVGPPPSRRFRLSRGGFRRARR